MARQPQPESIGQLLTQVCRAHRTAVSEQLSDLGLHPGQESVLCHVWHEDGLTQSELAQRLGVQPATVSKMLSRMERAGLISGCRDAADGRITRLHLTDAGKALFQPVQEAWLAVDAQILANFTLEERVLLRRLLIQVLHNLTDGS
ncbi:MAG: MarR family transcriptional regulator [Caldilineales bacterium]|nr:MarR family transcriptional regulator [Caldilineales bacterium]MDW8317642.1 MarR family transcriptional regulator [Anaerolineae bacterium]